MPLTVDGFSLLTLVFADTKSKSKAATSRRTPKRSVPMFPRRFLPCLLADCVSLFIASSVRAQYKLESNEVGAPLQDWPNKFCGPPWK
jgi:hypothetical protein